MVICPLMTSGTTGVNCIEAKCAFWDTLYSKCCHASHSERLKDSLEQILSVLNDMRGRM